MDQNLSQSGTSPDSTPNRSSKEVLTPGRDDGFADLNTSFFESRKQAESNSIFSMSAWKAGVLALGGLIASTGEAAITHGPDISPPARTAKLDAGIKAEQQDDLQERAVEIQGYILQAYNPEASRWERERAELELAEIDPGAQKLLPIAWKALRDLPADAPAWQREAYSLFTLSRQLNIEFLNRIDPDYQREVLNNRLNQMPDGRPLAISICTKGDHNGAFYLGANMYQEMVDAGYRVLYFEAENETQFMNALFTGTMLGTNREQKAELIIIGGHGSRTSLVFERWDNPQPGNEGHLDFSDEARFRAIGLGRTLARGGQIVLDSCSNGEGRADMDNIANFTRRVFPHAMPQGIWSATESYGPISLQFNPETKKLEKVEYPVPEFRAYRDGEQRPTGEADIRK